MIFFFFLSHDRTMQDIVYKLVPGLQEGECPALMHSPPELTMMTQLAGSLVVLAQLPFNKTFLPSLPGRWVQVTLQRSYVFCLSCPAAEIKKQREFYQKLGMEVPGDIKGELCNMKTHLDQRNGMPPPYTCSCRDGFCFGSFADNIHQSQSG